MKTATLLAFVCLSLAIIGIAFFNRGSGWTFGRNWVAPILTLFAFLPILWAPTTKSRCCWPVRR